VHIRAAETNTISTRYNF